METKYEIKLDESFPSNIGNFKLKFIEETLKQAIIGIKNSY
jgi:hypothetical protein